MKEESRKQNPWTDPEIEARIVALVLGEASDFEREELNRLIEEWPDLAAFKEQIQGVHGLLGDVVTGESVAEDDEWKLPAEKRSAVLAVIGGETKEQPAEQVVTKAASEGRRPVKRRLFWSLTTIATVVCVAGLLGVMAIPARFDAAMSDSNGQLRQLGLAVQDYHSTYSTERFGDQVPAMGGASAPHPKITLWNGATAWTPEDEYLRAAQPAAVADSDYERNSRSALLAIRGTLDADGVLPSPYYLKDDVQYFSAGREFELPPEVDTPREGRAGERLNHTPSAGVSGPGPGVSRQTVNLDGVAGVTSVGERNLSLDLDGDGSRPTGPPPTVSKSGNGELSFPMLAARADDRKAAEPLADVRSTIRVADAGTVLLGGIKRQAPGQSEHGASGESTVSSPMPLYDYGEPESGGETQDSAGTRMAALDERPVVENGAASSLELPALGIESEGSGQEQGIPRGQRRSREGTEFSVPSDLKGPLAAGEGIDAIVSGGGIVADSGGNAQADESGGDASAVSAPEAVTELESNAWRKADELAETAPSRPTIGGVGGMGGMGGMGGGGAGGLGSQDSPRDALFETKDIDADKLADALPAPTTEPQFSREDFETTEDLTVINWRKEEVVKERITIPSADDISLHDASGPARTPSYSIQIPEPVAGIPVRPSVIPDRRYARVDVPVPMTGTAIGQPPSALEGKQAKQEKHWSYDQNSNGDSGRDDRGLRGKRSVTFSVEDFDRPAITTWDESDETKDHSRNSWRSRSGNTSGGNGKSRSLATPATRKSDSYSSNDAKRRAKESLGKLAKLSDLRKNTELATKLFADDYVVNGGRSSDRGQSEPLGERGEFLKQRDQLATSGRNHWYRYVPPMLVDNSESMKAWGTIAPVPASLNEKAAQEEAFSTFSLHVSDVSFKLARAALANGQWPEAAKVRIEEFVNAFDYGDPMPTLKEKVSCRLEQSIHPFLQQRNLLRISMRTAAAGRSSNTPLRLTFVLDNSGSMERIDRQQTVRRAFALLAQQLKPIDQVTLISFARQPRLLADKVSGAQSHRLVELVADLPSEGGTNIEAALQLAFEKAKEQQVDGAQNRIVLLTDGAVNLGDANPESLSQMIRTMRVAGIAFDAAGICAEGLNDEVLEALTRKGDGRYYLLDSLEAADDGFALQIAGALRPSAKNVKVQVEFNPKRVGRYKLLGFEKHLLKQEDFRNDSVDAAEMAAAEAGVAMYQFEAKPDGEGDVGSVSVRFRDLSTGEMIENRWPIPYEAAAPRPDQAVPSLRVATAAALLAAKLRGEVLAETVDLKTLSDLIAGLPDQDRNADRVRQLHQMIQQARQLSGE